MMSKFKIPQLLQCGYHGCIKKGHNMANMLSMGHSISTLSTPYISIKNRPKTSKLEFTIVWWTTLLMVNIAIFILQIAIVLFLFILFTMTNCYLSNFYIKKKKQFYQHFLVGFRHVINSTGIRFKQNAPHKRFLC